MKFFVVTALLLLAAPANAQMPATCFAKVPAIAAKLGVPPHQPNYETTLSLMGCNGKAYDLLQLLNALIDKMDKAAKK